MIPDSQEIVSGQNLAGSLLAVEFGVVLSRVIASIENDPAQLRSVVYELARSSVRREAWQRSQRRTLCAFRAPAPRCCGDTSGVGGDAPRYSGDYDPSTVGPGERPGQPPRPSCSTQTYKVSSEAGGETSVSVVRCNGQ